METAVAAPARLAAVPFPPLLDVEDLHDADLDAVLRDRLLDAGALADLVSEPGAAISAHRLGARALLLAVR